jgi:competence protein ComEC
MLALRIRPLFTLLAMLLIAVPTVIGQIRTTLDIYVIDVEGGNAVLFVTPAGESVLIDTGNADGATRDAARIMDAVRDAGITRIDHLIITHWHADHFGGLAELAKQISIREFIDHGPNVQPGVAADQFLANVYPAITKDATRWVAKAGDRLVLKDVDWRIVASAGTVLTSPLPGANARNQDCTTFEPADNNAEDPMSVGSYVTFGQFRTVHLGDLTRNMEFKLMCPRPLLPPVQLFLGMHHGQESSNSPVMTHALRPIAAIMNDGTRKGGQPYTMRSIYTSPGFRDLWQVHFSLLSGQEYTTPGLFIANVIDNQPETMPIQPMPAPPPGPSAPPPGHNGKAYWIKTSARLDGTFTVTNARNGFSKTY